MLTRVSWTVLLLLLQKKSAAQEQVVDSTNVLSALPVCGVNDEFWQQIVDETTCDAGTTETHNGTTQDIPPEDYDDVGYGDYDYNDAGYGDDYDPNDGEYGDYDYPGCIDYDMNCAHWAIAGECDENPEYMMSYCSKSCKICDENDVADYYETMAVLDDDDDVLQIVQDVETQQVVRASIEYMRLYVQVEEQYESVRDACRNRYELCSYWAGQGECEDNPAFMKSQCAPACQSCEYLNNAVRCKFDPDEMAWEAGDLQEMFANLTNNKDYQEKLTILSHDPMVVMIDDFLSRDESNALIEWGGKLGYEQSIEVSEGGLDETYYSGQRTSTNTWCWEDCYEDPKTQGVLHRLGNITGIPKTNMEYLQLLKYDEGQFYGKHHDLIEVDFYRPQGVRVLTVFCYLNDVEAGGGTRFPDLDITVMPKRGRAVIWPSVLNDDPNKADKRMEHEALPVEAGVKYGANAWFHQRNFLSPHADGCVKGSGFDLF